MIVYWSVPRNSNDIFLGLDKPKSAFADFKAACPTTSVNNTFANFTLCPSVTDFSKNLFSLKSPINLDFTWTGDDIIFQNEYSEDFFKNIIVIRDAAGGSLSLRIIPYFFFTEETCEMQYTAPLLSDNDFIRKCSVIPGQINIGKWFRPTDHAFLIRERNQRVKIERDDTLANVRFLTNQKIEFKKFYFTDKCQEYFNKVVSFKHSQKNNSIKDYFDFMYSKFENSKLKNLILQEIKSNLME